MIVPVDWSVNVNVVCPAMPLYVFTLKWGVGAAGGGVVPLV